MTATVGPQVRMPSSKVTRLVVASRYVPVYIALLLLWIAASIWAPNMLASNALSALAPYAALLGITALGQMLVVMTGGIDLSTPGTFTFGALLMVGAGQQSDDRIATALVMVVVVSAAIGLANGILIGGLRLNPLISTLAVGSVVVALAFRYTRGFPVQRPVPAGWSSWTTSRIFGVSPVFWAGVALTIALVLVFRYTTLGRKFQVAGANPVAAQVVGVRFRLYQTFVYLAAAILYGLSGAALAGLVRTPGMGVGDSYLLGPIAAVVIGGAALTGGLASPMATFAAAAFLTGLNQMMQVMRLPTSLQFVVFGLVIIGGMLVSGDRIIKLVERVLRERRKDAPTLKQHTISGNG